LNQRGCYVVLGRVCFTLSPARGYCGKLSPGRFIEMDNSGTPVRSPEFDDSIAEFFRACRDLSEIVREIYPLHFDELPPR
jgi:hypothetical protein